jgi:hypothetical protein
VVGAHDAASIGLQTPVVSVVAAPTSVEPGEADEAHPLEKTATTLTHIKAPQE